MRTQRQRFALIRILMAAALAGLVSALAACQSAKPADPRLVPYAGIYTGAHEATGTEELTVKADSTFMEGYARIMRARGTWEPVSDRIILGHNDSVAVTSRPPNARIYYLLDPQKKTFLWANTLEELQTASRPVKP